MKWVPVPGWELRYEISEYGNVRSKDMSVGAKGGKVAIRKGRELALVLKTNGYLAVTLTDGVSRPQVSVHKLVARAFKGECPIGLHVLHGDGDKMNNHFTNLRYGTPAENVGDAARHGRRLRGSSHPMAKIDEDDVRMIRASAKSCRELARLFSVTPAHISSIQRNRVWKHTT
jgi:hypothetical protein